MIKRAIFLLLCIMNLTTHSVVLLSIPKCGTHLTKKLLHKLGASPSLKNLPENSWNVLINPNNIQALQRPNSVFPSHAIYTESNGQLLLKSNAKAIFIYRDPRDQIISMIHYVKQSAPHAWPNIVHIPINNLITLMIQDYSWIGKGIQSTWNIPEMIQLKGVNTFYTLYLPWAYHSNVYATQFEKLVGPKGGGNLEVQIKEIINIAKHLEINLTNEQAKKIASELFGGTETFRVGQIGSWKKNFSREQKELFKKHAGQLLIDLGYEKDLNW